MIQIGNTVVGLDIIEEKFVCDLSVCKGCCCVEGESGAPLEKKEIAILEKLLPIVYPYLTAQAKEVIQSQGVAYQDADGDLVTSIVNGKDCVFTCYDENGICMCAIDKAYQEGKTDFCKPVSCHLYPIRIDSYPSFRAVNYHRWDVCKAATCLGNEKGVRIFEFLKKPLIRYFGEAWYNELCLVAHEYLESTKKE